MTVTVTLPRKIKINQIKGQTTSDVLRKSRFKISTMKKAEATNLGWERQQLLLKKTFITLQPCSMKTGCKYSGVISGSAHVWRSKFHASPCISCRDVCVSPNMLFAKHTNLEQLWMSATLICTNRERPRSWRS